MNKIVVLVRNLQEQEKALLWWKQQGYEITAAFDDYNEGRHAPYLGVYEGVLTWRNNSFVREMQIQGILTTENLKIYN